MKTPLAICLCCVWLASLPLDANALPIACRKRDTITLRPEGCRKGEKAVSTIDWRGASFYQSGDDRVAPGACHRATLGCGPQFAVVGCAAGFLDLPSGRLVQANIDVEANGCIFEGCNDDPVAHGKFRSTIR